MSRCLRYQNPLIYRHLASQYVAGVMSRRVRLRTEVLRQKTPELDRAIAYWSDQFSELHQQLPEAQLSDDASERLWQTIDANAAPKELSSTGFAAVWNSLLTWRLLSGAGALSSMVLAVMLFFIAPEPSVTGPSYLANMVAHNDTDKNIQFVISAYAKQEDVPSRLHVQWSKDHAGKTSHPQLHLWAEDKDTGKIVYVGLQPPKGKNWDLTKPAWMAVANSRRLLMTTTAQQPVDSNTLFSGFCLQLKQWKT
jgi:anti-sigma-K factor RskA